MLRLTSLGNSLLGKLTLTPEPRPIRVAPPPQPVIVQLPGGQPVFEGEGERVVDAAAGAAMGHGPGGANAGLPNRVPV